MENLVHSKLSKKSKKKKKKEKYFLFLCQMELGSRLRWF